VADNTAIEWTDATWNPITGCSVVSPGCTNCYAMRLAGTRLQHHPSRAGLTRDSKAGPVWNGAVLFNEQWLDQPLRWSKPRMIFVCAHGDLFHESVPDEWIDRVFSMMLRASWHTYQVLTKRPARMRSYVTRLYELAQSDDSEWFARGGVTPVVGGWKVPQHIWLGVSAEDQKRADERIPHLLATPAAVRWVSAEPLLGPVDLRAIYPDTTMQIDALTGDAEHLLGLAGGESGPGARPMHPAWARSLRDQCAAAGVPFHFKQYGNWAPADFEVLGDMPRVHEFEDGTRVGDFGKKAAGRLLDGREHNGAPAHG